MQANQRVGRLTLLEQLPGTRPKKWTCRCECGTVKTFYEGNLKKGYSRSCGCLRKEVKAKVFGRIFQGAPA